MTSRMSVRRSDIGDALLLAMCVRDADRREVESSSGKHVLDVLEQCIVESDECWSAFYKNTIVGIWGVVGYREGSALTEKSGVVWLVTSTMVDKYPFLFWKECKRRLGELFERWDVLFNAIDERYEAALRWGAGLGFEFAEPRPFGAEGRPFQPFIVTRETANV